MPQQSSTADLILSSKEFRLLEGLRLNPRKTFSGQIRGERITRKKGISIEFSDYRDYAEGDDLRHLDWNVLARLENAVVKTYQDEEDLAVHLLLDTSPSMDFGDPRKLDAAVKIACAFGYVGLCGQDAVLPKALGRRQPPMQTLRGRSSYYRLARWASTVQPDGEKALSHALKEFASSRERPGLVVLISDGLDPDIATALRILAGRGHELGFVQVLSEIELDPDLEGDLRLVDAETGATVEITASSGTLKAYRESLAKHCEMIEAECVRVGGRFVQVDCRTSLDDLFFQKLKRQGWVSS
jgi:uncharacterized protein (DUF58 family)